MRLSIEKHKMWIFLMAAILAAMAPFVKLMMIYINLLNRVSYGYISYYYRWLLQTLNIRFDSNFVPQILVQMIWPLVLTLMIDKIYTRTQNKTFEHRYLSALIIWLLFNGSTLILQ